MSNDDFFKTEGGMAAIRNIFPPFNRNTRMLRVGYGTWRFNMPIPPDNTAPYNPIQGYLSSEPIKIDQITIELKPIAIRLADDYSWMARVVCAGYNAKYDTLVYWWE